MYQKKSISPYVEYRKSEDIHGTALYPAVMVGPMQRELLEEYLPSNAECTILDPFVGSGTSLYEASTIRKRARLIGSDINPLAILISRVKLEGVCREQVLRDIRRLCLELKTSQTVPKVIEFKGRDKWFRPDIACSLQLIRDAIGLIDDERNRRYFWYMMIDIIRKYCNSRSSTYKLHVRPKYQIDRIENKVIEDYIAKITGELTFFVDRAETQFELNQGDSLAYLTECDNDSFDYCITSPPYGDNGTTVPYGQYSSLALSWIAEKDLNMRGWELDSYVAIDSRSLGGGRHLSAPDDVTITDAKLKETIAKINVSKRKKVERFLRGYQSCLDEIMRVTKSTIIMTLGDRTVDGETVDLSGFTKRYLSQSGWNVEEKMRRPIPNKRTPYYVSRVSGKPVKSMKEELVLVATAGQ